jgi:hypothetical protein
LEHLQAGLQLPAAVHVFKQIRPPNPVDAFAIDGLELAAQVAELPLHQVTPGVVG